MKSLYYVKYEVETSCNDEYTSHRIVEVRDLTKEKAERLVNRLVDDCETHYLFVDYGLQR